MVFNLGRASAQLISPMLCTFHFEVQAIYRGMMYWQLEISFVGFTLKLPEKSERGIESWVEWLVE